MVSVCPQQNVEVRHFMDGEHQITLGLPKHLWPRLEMIAYENAKKDGWLSGHGSQWDYLNILINSLLVIKPKEIEGWKWIAASIK